MAETYLVYRSAITGKYVSEEYAEAHPDTTYSQETTKDEAEHVAALRERGEVKDPED